MQRLDLREIAQMVSGEIENSKERKIKGIAVDSRLVRKGDIFFALKGARRDGHGFLGDVAQKGAVAAVVERGNAKAAKFKKENPTFPLIFVTDTLSSLADLAHSLREKIPAKVIGITGTTGKTCTKDFLRSILSTSHRVVASPGTYNTEIGLPLTIATADESTELLVCEMGARHIGDIAKLAEIAKPNLGIITNIGPSHLEIFGSVENVAKAKSELAEALPVDGFLFLDAEDGWTSWIEKKTRAKVVKFGFSPRARYRARVIGHDGKFHPIFEIEGPGLSTEVRLSAWGSHLVKNALAAASVAAILGIDEGEIKRGLEKAVVTPGRMQVRHMKDGKIVIDDSYNANPLSMKAALDFLSTFTVNGRRTIAVLGDMAELGKDSKKYHRSMGSHASSIGVDILVTVGRGAQDIAVGALERGHPEGSVFHCANISRACGILKDITEPGDVILVKGSRVMSMEEVAKFMERYLEEVS
ncbi:MAG: UDP-N-acetylmuramoyl-tripeptide--D-alanyl-D-alanine ligase [Actinomycetota bacterium]|nr:UDP-N-acetylmuramoyl-tripeptide--D-alanyl-D-alanine ligase [Actinomycetota bacterium]